MNRTNGVRVYHIRGLKLLHARAISGIRVRMDPVKQILEKLKAELLQLRHRQRDAEMMVREFGQRAAIVEARISGIVETVELYESARASSPAVEPSQPMNIVVQTRQRTRRLTGHWREIMQRADRSGEFTYKDLVDAASATGHSVNQETLRSQMSGYKKAGIVVAKSNGVFELTNLGRRAADIEVTDSEVSPPNENEPSKGIPEDGSDTALAALF